MTLTALLMRGLETPSFVPLAGSVVVMLFSFVEDGKNCSEETNVNRFRLVLSGLSFRLTLSPFGHRLTEGGR
jgi:hypothetical protein